VAGRAKALAVTGDRRLAAMPDVPTFAEAGFAGFGPQQWTGLFVPAGTPRAVTARITGEFARALQSPDVLARLDDLHAQAVMSSQAEFTALLRREGDSLGKLIAARGIKVQ
jgi:tripartite-type tricarboxylate transporter receptor subunit TctC